MQKWVHCGSSAYTSRCTSCTHSPEIFKQVGKLFCTTPMTSSEKLDMDRLTRLAEGKTRSRRFVITPKVITEKVERSKTAAGPGPSGWRNAYVKLILEHTFGAQVMAEWATIWASGVMPQLLVAVWIPAMVRPFYKAILEGTIVRPVLCAEVLLNIPIGALVQKMQ